MLYFENQSRDTADAYLADGLSDEIRTRLGQVDRLTVTARTTMQRYRNNAADPQELARTLRVAHLVNGTVRRGPGRLRVGVELVRVRDGVQLWSETYDRTDNDLLAIETDVAGQVATAIAGRLAPAERATVTARATRNPAAYDRVLRGNFLMVRRTEADALRAVAEYQAAIALDPGYADAYARTAWAYSLFRNWFWHVPGISNDSVGVLARAAARRGLQLDSTSAMAWFAEAAVISESGQVAASEPALRRALALDPRLAEAHWLHATNRFRMGDVAGFFESSLRALALEPDRPITLAWLGMASIRERRFDEARRWLDSAVAVAPDFWYALSMRAGLRALQGDPGAAADAANGVRETRGADSTLAMVVAAFVQVSAGDSAAARALLAGASAGAAGTVGPLFDETAAWLAGTQLRLGQREAALQTVEHAEPTGYLWVYLGYPFFDPIRNDPRFQRVMSSLVGR